VNIITRNLADIANLLLSLAWRYVHFLIAAGEVRSQPGTISRFFNEILMIHKKTGK